MATTVKISETYDLSTEVDKMGLIGIHTPSSIILKSMYSGLLKNHKFVRLDHCDVILACASVQSADPLQVGTEAGKIAPEDMFNPMLYKAVSNESFNRVINRIYAGTDVSVAGSISKATIPDHPETNPPADLDHFKVYYGLLADDEGWRKAMPQAGLEMKGLYPIVYTVVSQFGNAVVDYRNDPNFADEHKVDINLEGDSRQKAWNIKGPSMRMPRMPIGGDGISGDDGLWPTTYVACLITPPAKLHKLYYRMKVVWTLTFEEVCPDTEREYFIKIAEVGDKTYGSDYAEQSASMTSKSEMVDTNNIDLKLVMTGSK